MTGKGMEQVDGMITRNIDIMYIEKKKWQQYKEKWRGSDPIKVVKEVAWEWS